MIITHCTVGMYYSIHHHSQHQRSEFEFVRIPPLASSALLVSALFDVRASTYTYYCTTRRTQYDCTYIYIYVDYYYVRYDYKRTHTHTHTRQTNLLHNNNVSRDKKKCTERNEDSYPDTVGKRDEEERPTSPFRRRTEPRLVLPPKTTRGNHLRR